MNYTLGSSWFFGGPRNVRDFSEEWCLNITRLDVKPARVVIICEGGTDPKFTPPNADIIRLSGDLGSWRETMKPDRKYDWSGWSASMVTLAMTAYVNCTDFAYQESDALGFGPRIKRMYRDMGDGSIVFGPKMTKAPWMATCQSFFLVRHAWIPTFVQTYLAMGGETKQANLGESKFARLAERYPKHVRYLSFGVDRQRPLPYDDEVWYGQQFSDEELAELKRRSLI